MTSDLFDLAPVTDPTGAVTLAHYAERAYLEYALSVVKGRALPDVCDGQKPVQRRILYAMDRMGLSFTSTGGPRPVKSALTARHQARVSGTPYIFTGPRLASCRRLPLTSNVRGKS